MYDSSFIIDNRVQYKITLLFYSAIQQLKSLYQFLKKHTYTQTVGLWQMYE